MVERERRDGGDAALLAPKRIMGSMGSGCDEIKDGKYYEFVYLRAMLRVASELPIPDSLGLVAHIE